MTSDPTSPPRSASISKKYPYRRDADGNRICAVCGEPCSLKYCSEACRDKAYVRCWPDWARYMVAKRDHGICAKCKCDTEKIARILKAAHEMITGCSWGRCVELDTVRTKMGFTREHLWEVDHIQPVSEGGGLCGLENLQTLCTQCHDAETRALRGRLAADRRAAEPMPLFTEIAESTETRED